MNSDKKEYILCAAIYYMDEKVRVHQPRNIESGFVICGRMHHNIHSLLHSLLGYKLSCDKISGFITSKNNFVDRIEGLKIAYNAGQTDKKEGILFSEDLY
jgi:hypothetical protein